MDYVTPAEIMTESLQIAKKKASLPIRDLLVRGILAGAFLGFATSLAIEVVAQGSPPILGALLFPVGFVMLVLLGLELATGNFALLPPALIAGQVRMSELLRNWLWVYFGNLIGSVLYAFLFYLAISNFGTMNGGALGDQLRQIAQKKTLAYMSLGYSGWGVALVKGILCNWMVTVGTMLALASRSTIGKIAAMWLPILTFFAQGYEHSVVNMFVLPAGIFLGAPVTVKQWWWWNQIPVTIGNIFSGALLTGLALYVTYSAKSRLPVATVSAPARLSTQEALVMQPEGQKV
jgi:formate/nitrite transporter